MPRALSTVTAIILLLPRAVLAHGDGTFLAPLEFPLVDHPVGSATADFNGDGAPDLAVVNATNQVWVFLQDPLDRTVWRPQPPIVAGNGCYFVLAQDLDADGKPDLAVADPGGVTFILRGRGDGTFEDPRVLSGTVNTRLVAAGDLDQDGTMDLVSLDAFQSFSIHRGLGVGQFQLVGEYQTMNAHDLLILDHDGNGVLDIMVKTKETGIFPFRGRGDCTFEPLPLIDNLTVRGPIATADFDRDGKGDLMTDYGVGISQGDGTYVKTLEIDRPFMPVGAADLTGDGFEDALVAGMSRNDLEVYAGNGDGTFQPAVTFGATQAINSFAVTDLDADGHADLVVAGERSLMVFWGRAGERFLEITSALAWPLFSSTLAVGDLGGDGFPDLIVPAAEAPRVQVLEAPGAASPGALRVLSTANLYSQVAVADLDADGLPDLVAANALGQVFATLLDAAGGIEREQAHDIGYVPLSLAIGRIDAGMSPDVAAVCGGANQVSVLLGAGGGSFTQATPVSTPSRPRDVAIADLDLDGAADMVVGVARGISVHYGTGTGEFPQQASIDTEPTGYTLVRVADLDADGRPDIVGAGFSGVYAWHGKPGREFDARRSIMAVDRAFSLDAADLDGDALPDLTIARNQEVLVLINQGALSFAKAVSYPLGFVPLGHRVADLDVDGASDLVIYHSSGAVILFGRPEEASALFRRGDSNDDSIVNLTDAVHVLLWLFAGGEMPGCMDSADANHDGQHDLTDSIVILSYLFLGGSPPPPPGPMDCGPGSEPSMGCEESECP